MREAGHIFPCLWISGEKKILIVGAGTIAARRAEALLGFGPDLTVVAPEISEKILELAEKGRLQVRTRAYQTGDCQGCWMVLAASDDPKLNAQVCKEAKEAGAVVNNASDRTQCDFLFSGTDPQGTGCDRHQRRRRGP